LRKMERKVNEIAGKTLQQIHATPTNNKHLRINKKGRNDELSNTAHYT